jgi:hypothetical protein
LWAFFNLRVSASKSAGFHALFQHDAVILSVEIF